MFQPCESLDGVKGVFCLTRLWFKGQNRQVSSQKPKLFFIDALERAMNDGSR